MNDRSPNYRNAFACVTTLFFAWGFITSTVDPLIAAVKSIFDLSTTSAFLSQFAFFMSYGVISLPAAGLVGRLGVSSAVSVALGTMIVGCLLFPVAVLLNTFGVVLLALFVLGSGITLLQVAANPLAAALGPHERSHFRLTFSQAFNSLGTVLGPFIIGHLILAGGVFGGAAGAAVTDASRAESLHKIEVAFVGIAVVIFLLAAFLWKERKLIASAVPAEEYKTGSIGEAFRSGWAMSGALAIFLYVGAEVSIGSIMILFLVQPEILGVSHTTANSLLSMYWGGAMVGRFIGSWLLRHIAAGRLLATAAFIAALLCLAVSQSTGMFAAGAAIAIGLFNSIMFPTIFSLTLERSSAPTNATSGLLCMAIIGGALLPVVFASVADHANISTAYFIPMLAYLGIATFAVMSVRAAMSPGAKANDAVRATH